MRRWICALGLVGLLAGDGVAQTVATPLSRGFTQLFISPCGEPYRGKPGDPYPVVLWFKQADLNHDGVIDLAEFRADHAGFFDALDADGNGYLDGTEVGFYEHQVVPDVYVLHLGALLGGGEARLLLAQYPGAGQPQGPPSESGATGGAHGPMETLGARRREKQHLEAAAPYGLLAEAEPVAAADTDLDGRVTKAEFLAAADRRFKRLDLRHDGKLTLDELPMTQSQAEAAAQKRR